MLSINRREFLRLASLMGGASLFAGCSLFGESAEAPEYIKGAPAVDPVDTLLGVKNVYTVCGLCPGNCGVCCRVAEGALVKIGGNPYNPIAASPVLPFDTPPEEAASRGASVCAIGGSGVQTLYDPFRVARPLKRDGQRGSGRWKAVTWKQALDDILDGGDLFGEGRVEGLRQTAAAGGGLRLVAGRIDWGAMTFLQRFMAAFPGAVMMRDRDAYLSEIAKLAAESVFGPGIGPVAPDYSSARVVISFGDAPLDSGIPLVSLAREISDARVGRSGLKWAVVDPRLSTSASKADMWIPVRPGHDLSLVKGIMRVLFDKGQVNPNLADQPYRAEVMSRPLDDYSRDSGVSVKDMERLAGLLAQGGSKSAAMAGKGILAGPNGRETAEAIFTLNIMVGSAPGSGGLFCRDDSFLDEAFKAVMVGVEYRDEPPTSGPPAKVVILWNADPVYHDRQSNGPLFVDRREIPLFVAIAGQITETTALADYILPDTTYLERWDVCRFPASVAAAGVGFRKPAVGGFDPAKGIYFPLLPETRPMEDILIDFAKALALKGFGEKGLAGNSDLNTSGDYYSGLIGAVLASMNKAGYPVAAAREDHDRALERGGVFFSTEKLPSGKHKTSTMVKPWNPSDSPAAKRQALGSLAEDEFELLTYSLPFHRDVISGINSWLLETLPENPLLINTADARRLGIKQGATVTLQPKGSADKLRVKAQVIPGIMPGVVALATGFGGQQLGASPFAVDGRVEPPDKTRAAGVNAYAARGDNMVVQVKKT